jgi:hypothetical protein
MRTKERVLEILETAFLPLACKAELHKDEIGFRVDGPNGDVLWRQPKAPASKYMVGPTLEQVVKDARAQLEDEGHELGPWSMPAD